NNIKSVCGGADDSTCHFEFRAADTPVASAISPLAANSGSTLTISGSGLQRPNAKVYIGHSECTITEQSDTEIQCTVPAHTTATLPVYVAFEETGFAASPAPLLFTHTLDI